MKPAALNLLHQVDHHTLLRYPRVWLLGGHWVLLVSAVACLAAYGVGRAFPVSVSNVPSADTYFSIGMILSGIVSLWWMYRRARFAGKLPIQRGMRGSFIVFTYVIGLIAISAPPFALAWGLEQNINSVFTLVPTDSYPQFFAVTTSGARIDAGTALYSIVRAGDGSLGFRMYEVHLIYFLSICTLAMLLRLHGVVSLRALYTTVGILAAVAIVLSMLSAFEYFSGAMLLVCALAYAVTWFMVVRILWVGSGNCWLRGSIVAAYTLLPATPMLTFIAWDLAFSKDYYYSEFYDLLLANILGGVVATLLLTPLLQIPINRLHALPR